MAMRTYQESQESGIPQAGDRAVRRPEVLKLIGWSKTTLYAAIRAGRFPKGFRIGSRARAWWLHADVMAWLNQQAGA